jgi:hypothetical protein
MNVISIDGGTFQKDLHIYRDEQGIFIPSLTQIFKLQGLTDYSGVPPDVLRKAQLRGTLVHELIYCHLKYNDVDETWIDDDIRPRWEAYLHFRKMNHFIPDPNWIERGVVTTLFGMKVAMTPDVFGKLNGHDAVIEWKCADTAQPSWAFQTAAQECAIYKTTRAGRAQRLAVQLRSNGKYHFDPHDQHAYDISQFVAATTSVYGRLNAGQKVWEKLAA